LWRLATTNKKSLKSRAPHLLFDGGDFNTEIEKSTTRARIEGGSFVLDGAHK
jgi:hypothetical protein